MIHPKMNTKKENQFTHPYFIPNLYDFLYFVEQKDGILKEISPRCFVHAMKVTFIVRTKAVQNSSNYIILCSIEESNTGLECNECEMMTKCLFLDTPYL